MSKPNLNAELHNAVEQHILNDKQINLALHEQIENIEKRDDLYYNFIEYIQELN